MAPVWIQVLTDLYNFHPDEPYMLEKLKFDSGHEKFSGIYKLMSIQLEKRPVWKLLAYMELRFPNHTTQSPMSVPHIPGPMDSSLHRLGGPENARPIDASPRTTRRARSEFPVPLRRMYQETGGSCMRGCLRQASLASWSQWLPGLGSGCGIRDEPVPSL